MLASTSLPLTLTLEGLVAQHGGTSLVMNWRNQSCSTYGELQQHVLAGQMPQQRHSQASEQLRCCMNFCGGSRGVTVQQRSRPTCGRPCCVLACLCMQVSNATSSQLPGPAAHCKASPNCWHRFMVISCLNVTHSEPRGSVWWTDGYLSVRVCALGQVARGCGGMLASTPLPQAWTLEGLVAQCVARLW